jgi:predicted GIY-YIG superfamily endonuclease
LRTSRARDVAPYEYVCDALSFFAAADVGPWLVPVEDMGHGDRRIVYILRSVPNPARHYIGITADLNTRLDWHNHGPSGYTIHNRPWAIVVSLHFPDERQAARFERYLKSASGRAFSKRHFGIDAGGLLSDG